eukprot:1159180-Pelagomonas_calceolata.AAC.2
MRCLRQYRPPSAVGGALEPVPNRCPALLPMAAAAAVPMRALKGRADAADAGRPPTHKPQ